MNTKSTTKIQNALDINTKYQQKQNHQRHRQRVQRIIKLQRRIKQENNQKPIVLTRQLKYQDQSPLISRCTTLSSLAMTMLWFDNTLIKLINLFPLQLRQLEQVLPSKKLTPLLYMLTSTIGASDRELKYGYCQFEIGMHNKEKQSLWKEHAIYMLENCQAVWDTRWDIREYRNLVYDMKYRYTDMLSVFNISSIYPIENLNYQKIGVENSTLIQAYKYTEPSSISINRSINQSRQSEQLIKLNVGIIINKKIQQVLVQCGIDKKYINTRCLFMRIFDDYQKY